jgi:DNA-binding beta-propeller fold protein YncE
MLAAVVPGIVVGVACEAAWNHPGLENMVYNTPVVLVLGYLARFAFVGALLGRWMTRNEPRVLGDLRRLDRAETLAGMLRATWPAVLAVGGATGAVVAVLSMSELAVTARLQPRGFATIAQGVLHAVHYQRPDTVLLATLGLIGVGLAAGSLAVGAWWPLRRWGGRTVVLLGCVAALGAGAGCGQTDPDDVAPLRTRSVFGASGRSLGQFHYPRGIAVDHDRRLVYVVDKTARVQRYGFDGEPQLQWRMPQWDNGKPTGLGVSPDGRVFVADTHYHRVIAYDNEGRELMRFGRYGSGPGEFIYPTDVAFGPEGRVYVSEYGGNERVGVFSAEGKFLFSFGGPGSGVGQFQRPQAMAFSADLGELYIADACNHRIVVTDPEGRPQRALGGPGRGAGLLAYPYDVMVLEDGTLLVSEFGNNRLQRFSTGGQCLGLYGRVGSGEGELRYPWGVDGTNEKIFVLDSGNNRVQVIGGI